MDGLCRFGSIALSLLLLSACDKPPTTPDTRALAEFDKTHPVGRFQAVVRPDNSIWLVDTQTGAIQRCDLPKNEAIGHCWKSLPVR